MKILFIGGSGLLGKYLVPLLQKDNEVHTPTHEDFDITKPINPKGHDYDLVILVAAYTNVAKAEKDKRACYETNVDGIANVAMAFPKTPIVYISSEYAWNPVNYYGETKAAGEVALKAYNDTYLIIRTLFKPTPFPYEKAFVDQFTQGDYVDVIARLLCERILEWDLSPKTIVVGTGRKNMYGLARKTKPDVEICHVDDIKGYKIPKDYEDLEEA